MTDKDNIPTLGGGFGKKPAQWLWNADEIQKMQQGYETRIARQRDAITRLQAVAGAQVQMFEEWMRTELERAGRIEESDQGPLFMADSTGYDMDSDDINAQLAELLKMIPAEWDTYNEDDTPFTLLQSYIQYTIDNDRHWRQKRESLKQWLRDHVVGKEGFVLKEGELFRGVRRYVNYLEDQLHTAQQSLSQAITDARHNAQRANEALRVVDADDTPPWVQTPPQAFVQPATIGASGVWDNEPDRRDSKTLDDWAPPDNQLPPGETRPGSF